MKGLAGWYPNGIRLKGVSGLFYIIKEGLLYVGSSCKTKE